MLDPGRGGAGTDRVPADSLAKGREAFADEAWSTALARLTEADASAPLGLDDLERAAVAAYLIGRDEASTELSTRAYAEALRVGDVDRAARAAFWLGFGLLSRGETVRGGGWLARAARHADDAGPDSVVHGYLLVTAAIGEQEAGNFEAARAASQDAARIAGLHGDADLATFARLGLGDALIGLGQVPHGTALLDEAMVAVTAGEVTPIVMGIAYCAVIETCQRIFDLGRAHEWTAALAGWCTDHPDLVPYRGSCLVYRADLLTLHGAWPEALDEARRASDVSTRAGADPVAGEAAYRRAELHRLRGEAAEAEEAYREANRLGRAPQPGLALLRLDQGRVASAASAIRRAAREAADPAARPRVLDALVEIALAAGDVAGAGAAADELAALAAELDAPVLQALASRAQGSVLLAEGEVASGLFELQRALATWQTIEAPYEAARVRVLVAEACVRLGDDDTAELELDAADRVFRELRAVPARRRLEAIQARRTTGTLSTLPGGLTPRELEVIRLVAAGKTNRAIAADLVISEKTVARHVSNIFTKLDLSSRSAATAYAYEHGLVDSSA
jgi:DNA-binding CsgD family transcriptional regulator